MVSTIISFIKEFHRELARAGSTHPNSPRHHSQAAKKFFGPRRRRTRWSARGTFVGFRM